MSYVHKIVVPGILLLAGNLMKLHTVIIMLS